MRLPAPTARPPSCSRRSLGLLKPNVPPAPGCFRPVGRALTLLRAKLERAGPGPEVPALCLAHAAEVISLGLDDGVARQVVSATAAKLKRLSEDMRTYSLKRQSLRRRFINDEEETAYRDVLVRLAGHPLLAAPARHDGSGCASEAAGQKHPDPSTRYGPAVDMGATGEVPARQAKSEDERAKKRAALKFVLMVGVMSLFADLTYEGSRSIVGPYLGLLGAGAFAISVVTGFGEFLGYALRLVSGAELIAPGGTGRSP